MREKMLSIIAGICIISFMICACMLDSASDIPFYLTIISGIGYVTCYIISIKEVRHADQ